MNESSPFIVTGCQSSGTTLLAHLLDRSQSIRLGLEEGIIRALLYWFWNNVSRSASGFRYSRIGDFPRIISGLRHEPRYNEVRHRLERALISMQETGELDFYLERHRVREFI